MKTALPRIEHESYIKHRSQMWQQIILPVVLATVLMLVLIVLICVATFRDNGDVGRWAAISTIWIVIPILFAGLVTLVILGGLIYLMMRLLGILPTYTGLAQDYVQLWALYVQRFTEAAVKPIFAVDGLVAYFKAIFGRQ
jgi:hypothetical protein